MYINKDHVEPLDINKPMRISSYVLNYLAIPIYDFCVYARIKYHLKISNKSRPFSQTESEIITEQNAVKSVGNTVMIHRGAFQKSYSFDTAFNENTSQEDVFTSTVSNILDDYIGGTNCSYIMMGGDNSGRSYTCFGPEEEVHNPATFGVIPRTIQVVLRKLKAMERKYSLKMSLFYLNNDVYIYLFIFL